MKGLTHVPMVCLTIVGAIDSGGDRRDPDSIETHALDIVELMHDATPVASAILLIGRVAGRGRTVPKCETIGHDLCGRSGY